MSIRRIARPTATARSIDVDDDGVLPGDVPMIGIGTTGGQVEISVSMVTEDGPEAMVVTLDRRDALGLAWDIVRAALRR